LIAKLKTDQAFARFDYDVSGNLHAYAQVSGTISRNRNPFSSINITNHVISRANPFLPDLLRQAPAAPGSPQPTYFFAKLEPYVAPWITDARTTNLFANAGLEGKLGEAFRWDLSFAHGRTIQRVIAVGNVNQPRFWAAIDAVDQGQFLTGTPNRNIVCRITLTNPEIFPGCRPLNIFGNRADPAAWDLVRDDTSFRLTQKLTNVSASVVGTPFNSWAGPVRVALSGEYRRQSLRNISTAQPTERPTCAGLRFQCNPQTSLVWLTNTVANASGKLTVAEAAVEADVPILKDSAIGSLNLNGAARYTDYSTSGSVVTWKVGADWNVTGDLRFRAAYSRDIRAPTLTELFAPTSLANAGLIDVHTGLTSQVTQQSSGNPDLTPERALTLTVGAVYRPRWLPGFSAALDYYRIRITDAIASLTGSNSVVQAQCEASGGTSPLCALLVRPLPFSDRSPANFPTLILSQPVNVASTRTHGVDGELNYRTRIAGGGLSLRLLGSYQPELVTLQFQGPGVVPINEAGAANLANLRITGFVSYERGPFTIATQTRWRAKEKPAKNGLAYDMPDIPAISFTDLNIAYEVGHGTKRTAEMFVTISNLFDKRPALFSGANATVAPGINFPTVAGDDLVGRAYTIGMRTRF
jgi:iron complex outermembrane recepter protein